MPKSEEQLNKEAMKEKAYFDMLYSFSCVVSKANKRSFEGGKPRDIARYLRKTRTAFNELCMLDELGEKTAVQSNHPRKQKKITK